MKAVRAYTLDAWLEVHEAAAKADATAVSSHVRSFQRRVDDTSNRVCGDMVDYCFKWNYADGAPGVSLTEDEARVKNDAGEEYTAIMPPRAGTRMPVLVTPVWKTGVVVVTFLDGSGRKATEYTFMKKADESLFLTRVHMWTYPNDEPGLRLSDSSSHETIYYREDGHVKRIVKNKVEHLRETAEHTDVPVDTNWEPIPTFGDYRSIARYERDGQ